MTSIIERPYLTSLCVSGNMILDPSPDGWHGLRSKGTGSIKSLHVWLDLLYNKIHYQKLPNLKGDL